MTGMIAENWESKQFSAVTPVICKACQIGNQSSAVTPVICNLYQAGKND
jgi:hypothetical protein